MKIILSRPKQVMDIGRPYMIRTETVELKTISAGEQIEVEVPDDTKELFAVLAWFSSNGVLGEELKDKMHIEVRNRCSGWRLLVPLVPLYYITIAKYRYLKLSVIDKT